MQTHQRERLKARQEDTPDRGRMWSAITRRGWIALAGLVLLVGVATGGMLIFGGGDQEPAPPPGDVRGSPAWSTEHYGRANSPNFRARNVVEIDFLGEPMYVHKKAVRHFLRLADIFRTEAPEYAATIAVGATDDWSYFNRAIRGERAKSNHAFGLAVDINALANPLGTEGDIPAEVVAQWELEGGEWGGDWARPDPMHFETHLTPEEIKSRYGPDGEPLPGYLDGVGG